MQSMKKALIFGLLVWAVPFLVGVLAYGLKTAGSPLFETVMAVTVAAVGVFFGIAYFQRVPESTWREGLYLGVLWLGISIVIDLFLFMWGPMKMTFGAYMADTGVTYLIYPIITSGLGKLVEQKTAA